LRAQVSFAEFVKRFAGDDLVRTEAFNSFYPYPALQRTYDEARAAQQGFIPKSP
jgi:hypothetical protein